MTDLWMLLAQAASQPATPGPTGSGDAFLRFTLPLLMMIGIFYLIVFRGRSKDQKRHDSMLKALKRNDRVQTVGGVRGVVVEVRDDEVTLKVDESSNVKMRFSRGSIKEVLTESAGDTAAK